MGVVVRWGGVLVIGFDLLPKAVSTSLDLTSPIASLKLLPRR